MQELLHHYLAYEEYETLDEEMYSVSKEIVAEVLEAIWVRRLEIQLGKMTSVGLGRKGESGLLNGLKISKVVE